MEKGDFYSLTRREKRKVFFRYAEKLGLVNNGFYISGIPSGEESDVNFFYFMEDALEYPKPCKIPKNYLTKWRKYDDAHMINLINGMIVSNSCDLDNIQPTDVKGFERL